MRTYTAGVNRTLYTLRMNEHKTRIHQETKDRMYREFVEECRKVVEAYDGVKTDA